MFHAISQVLLLFFVSWQHSGLSRVRLRHGRGGQHVHGALQGAEISGLHLDAVSRGKGSQAKVHEQLVNSLRSHSCASDALPHPAPPPRATAAEKGGGSLSADEAWDHFTDGCLISQMHQPDQSPIYQQAN